MRREAVRIADGRIPLEVSGGVSLETVRGYLRRVSDVLAATGIGSAGGAALGAPFLSRSTGSSMQNQLMDAMSVVRDTNLRLQVADEPGVLSQLTAILAAHDISVEAILQREPRGGDDATVALITSVIPEHRFDDALAEMQKLPFVRPGAARFRVAHEIAVDLAARDEDVDGDRAGLGVAGLILRHIGRDVGEIPAVPRRRAPCRYREIGQHESGCHGADRAGHRPALRTPSRPSYLPKPSKPGVAALLPGMSATGARRALG